MNALLPGILRQFRLEHPLAEFHLQEATTAEQLIALRDDRADIGMVVLPVAPQEGLQISLSCLIVWCWRCRITTRWRHNGK